MKVVFFIAVLLFTVIVSAQKKSEIPTLCINILNTPNIDQQTLSVASEHLQAQQYQLLYWQLKQSGNWDEANRIKDLILERLLSLDNTKLNIFNLKILSEGYRNADLVIPMVRKAEGYSFEDYKHTMYLSHVDGLPVLIKFNNFAIDEEVYSRLGDLLHYEIPFARKVEIDGHEASVHVFLPDTPNYAELLNQVDFMGGHDGDAPLKSRMVLELTQKFDHNDNDYLYANDLLISVDYEGTIPKDFSFFRLNGEVLMSSMPYEAFWNYLSENEIKEMMQEMRTQNTAMHNVLIDPGTFSQIKEIFASSSTAKANYLAWMQYWLENYRKYATQSEN